MPLSAPGRIQEARERARSLGADLAAAAMPEIPWIIAGAGAAGDESCDEGRCRAILRQLASGGLLAHLVPAAYGGAAGDLEIGTVAAIREELAYSSGLLDLLFVMQGLGSYPITLAGTEELKRRWLPRVASGEAVAALAVTEPEAGSDVSAIRTAARRAGGGYVLDGVKTFISNAPFADVITVIAQADAAKGRKGLTAFVVERGADGLSARADLEIVAPHPIGTLVFENCRVEEGSRLGAEGEGFSLVMATLDRFRLTVGAAAVGFARRALDEAVRFSKQRVQFGRPIAEFEGIQFKLAEAATKLEASRLLVERAAATSDRALRAPAGPAGGARIEDEGFGAEETGASGRSSTEALPAARRDADGSPTFPLSPLGEDASREAAMAKLFATEAAQEIVDEAVQIHGGRGLVRGGIVERLYREVRALRIYEGTSEIQRTVIARALLGR